MRILKLITKYESTMKICGIVETWCATANHSNHSK